MKLLVTLFDHVSCKGSFAPDTDDLIVLRGSLLAQRRVH